MKRVGISILRYIPLFLLITVGMTLVGAVLGAVLFPIGGLIFGEERSLLELVIDGARSLGFWAFIWAPGTAIVICFWRGFKPS